VNRSSAPVSNRRLSSPSILIIRINNLKSITYTDILLPLSSIHFPTIEEMASFEGDAGPFKPDNISWSKVKKPFDVR
jgi:hypothetical protein